MKEYPVRFVTAYGLREKESHAIIALIYIAIRMMDPYTIWGDDPHDEILHKLRI
jgi:hypothetical protein